MQSILITGSDQKSRQLFAQNLADSKSSKFDTKILDTSEVRGIEAVKEVIAATSRKPFESGQTSILILESQNLTIEAQNALLKTLEEAPDLSQLILTSPSKDLLLPTVASRLTEISLSHTKTETQATIKLNKFKTQTLNERLTQIEKLKRSDYLDLWAEALKTAVLNNSENLKAIHRYNKLLLKMVKGEKALVNKKLIDLILALETP